MAVEREVLKDITEYEAQIIGPLSIRQATGTGIAALVAIPTYLGLSNFFITDVCVITAAILAMPFLAIGWWHPYGVPFEKFIYKLLQLYILCPINRKYKTENLYKELEDDPYIPPKLSYSAKKKLKKKLEAQGYVAYK